jgi:hypothetical protein
VHAAKGNGIAASEFEAVWIPRLDFNGSSVRAGGRRVAAAGFWVDGARVPVRERSGEDLGALAAIATGGLVLRRTVRRVRRSR